MDRSNSKYFKNITNEMKDSPVLSIRNAGKLLGTGQIPIYIMYEDITKDTPIDIGQGLMIHLEQIEQFSASMCFREIFLHPRDYYQDKSFEYKGLRCSASQKYKKVSLKESLFMSLAHETNHIINRRIVSSDIYHFMLSIQDLTPFGRAMHRAKDEFHAYKAVQQQVYGLSDKDIKQTIKDSYCPDLHMLDIEHACKLEWDYDNSGA